MHLIKVLGIVAFTIPFVILIVGCVVDDDSIGIFGYFGMLLVFLLALSFKAGAHWQNDDINVKYLLTPKEAAK